MAEARLPWVAPYGHAAPLEYHRRLLDDAERVAAYDRALRRLVRPGDVVLDVGAGTGLLAMLAARRGAARVHAVESMPVARLARRLVDHNGLGERVVVHEADMRALDPVEPVDLVVSEFMGRFVVDDEMLGAVRAATRWLKPGGRFCPSKVRLRLAPVGGIPLRPLDLWREQLLGLDLTPGLVCAEHAPYHTDLGTNTLLAPSRIFRDLDPLALPDRYDVALSFGITRGAALVGLAGWFEARLADDVVLSTEPGIDTHWGQVLFPVPTFRVEPGDLLAVRFVYLPDDLDAPYRWSGEVRRGDAVVHAFAQDSSENLGPVAA